MAKAASSLLNSCRSRENGGLERYGLGPSHCERCTDEDLLHVNSVVIFVMFCSHLISTCYLSLFVYLSISPTGPVYPIHPIYMSYLCFLYNLYHPIYLIHLIHPFYLIYLQCLNLSFNLIFSILFDISYLSHLFRPIACSLSTCQPINAIRAIYPIYRINCIYRIIYPVCPSWPPVASISLRYVPRNIH